MGPQGAPKGQKGKCLAGRKTIATFYWILWGPFRTSLFPPGSNMGSQGTAKGTKTENVWQVKKTLSSFYWNSWGPFRTSLFPPGSSMGSQGTAKGTETENVWQVKKHYQVFIEIHEVLSGPHFFHKDPVWDPKGQPKGAKGEHSTDQNPQQHALKIKKVTWPTPN